MLNLPMEVFRGGMTVKEKGYFRVGKTARVRPRSGGGGRVKTRPRNFNVSLKGNGSKKHFVRLGKKTPGLTGHLSQGTQQGGRERLMG